MLLRAALLTITTLAATTAAAEEFTRVPALEPNVAFWKKVYIEWGVNQIAFHDEEDLGIVYKVITVPGRGEKNSAGVSRADAIRAGQSQVEAALRSLAKKNPKSADALTGVEKEVFINLQRVTRADKYNRTSTVRVQNGLRERFLQGWNNSGLYDGFIKNELRTYGLPEELIAVAFVESLFYVGAKSKVGAAGVWQFMSYTGKEYMQLNAVVDERWDPILATEAACKYLRQAKKELGTWPLAITSYNYGRAGVKGLASNAGTKDFGVILAVSKNKRFGFAARNYYASFLAINEILKAQSTLLKGFPRKPAWSYDVIRAPFPLYTTQLAATGEVDSATLDYLNPAFTVEARDGKIPLPHGISLRVPKGKSDKILQKLAALPERDKNRGMRAVKSVHKSTGKESINTVAKKYGLSGDTLAAAIGVAADDVPSRGQSIPIPHASARYTLLPEARSMPLPAMPAPVKILLADASELPPSVPVVAAAAAVVEKPAKPERGDVVLAVAAAAPVRSRGRITIGPISEGPVGDAIPAVDVIAGTGSVALPEVDAVAGDPGADAPWVTPAMAAPGAPEPPPLAPSS